MDVKVKVYDGSKYDMKSVKIADVIYKNIQGFTVKKIADQDMYIEGFDEVDELGEYLIITLENGETATFRNTRVELFRA